MINIFAARPQTSTSHHSDLLFKQYSHYWLDSVTSWLTPSHSCCSRVLLHYNRAAGLAMLCFTCRRHPSSDTPPSPDTPLTHESLI